MAEPPPPKRAKNEDSEEEEAKAKDGGVVRFMRRKYLLLLSYSGKGYMGMQRNPGFQTIEEELIQALFKCQLITDQQRDVISKAQFQRCARTDKGVSAARQAVSIKMRVKPGIVEELNSHLPKQIRVMGIKRVTKSFNSKDACSSRVYEYLLPTFAFAPLEQTNLAYRIDAGVLGSVQSVLSKYVGTHNFHNFTSGKKFHEASAKRYIMSFVAGQPFLHQDVEFMTLSVEGQSFMLHQIRKMIGLTIAIVRGKFPEEMLPKTFEREKVDIPRAPALGLLLDSVKYDRYNKKFGGDGMHEKLEWSEYEDAITAFKSQYIHSVIIETELRELSMLRWLDTLLIHDFHHTAQRLSEEQQRKVEASATDQTSVASVESSNNHCMDREGTNAGKDPDVCLNTAEPGGYLDASDDTELGNNHQTHEVTAAQAVMPAFCDPKVPSFQEQGTDVNISDLKNPP